MGKKSFVIRFVSIFILMLAIIVILPFLVEHAVMLFSVGVQPGRNSIIVFKPLMVEYEYMSRFMENFKKIINFM